MTAVRGQDGDGSGQTKVLNLVLAWCFDHKLYEADPSPARTTCFLGSDRRGRPRTPPSNWPGSSVMTDDTRNCDDVAEYLEAFMDYQSPS
jgi:hypothetical protein